MAECADRLGTRTIVALVVAIVALVFAIDSIPALRGCICAGTISDPALTHCLIISTSVIIIALVTSIPAAIASVWLLACLRRLEREHRKLCLAQLLTHLAIANLFSSLLRIGIVSWASFDSDSIRNSGQVAKAFVSTAFVMQFWLEAAIAVAMCRAISRASCGRSNEESTLRVTRSQKVSSWTAWFIAVEVFLMIEYDRFDGQWATLYMGMGIVCATVTPIAYLRAIFLAKRSANIGATVITRRVALLYLAKVIVLDVPYVVTVQYDLVMLQNAPGSADWLFYCSYGLFCSKPVLDAICYAGSIRIAMRWLAQRVACSEIGIQNVDVSQVSKVLALRLDVFASLREFHLDLGQNTDSMPSTDPLITPRFSQLSERITPVSMLSCPIQACTLRRDATSHRQSSAIMSIVQDVEAHYLKELFAIHLAELLGIVRNSAAEIELGIKAADVLHHAETQITLQHDILLQSVQIRLEARDGQVVSPGGHESLWHNVESQHIQAMHVIKPLLLRLSDAGLVSDVRTDVAAMLRDKQKELEDLYSAKFIATERLYLHEESLAKSQKEEETFADAAVKLAIANSTSSMVQHSALRAIARVMHLSTMASEKRCLKENWAKYLKENRETIPEGCLKDALWAHFSNEDSSFENEGTFENGAYV